MNGPKKLQQLLAVLFIFTILLCSCRKAENTLSTKQEPSLPTIVIGSDNYPPFNYSGTDGRPTGIDVELATEAFHRMGYQAEFVTIDWENKKSFCRMAVSTVPGAVLVWTDEWMNTNGRDLI